MSKFAFTGDVKDLKKIGYKFEKTHSSNHKSYCKDRIIMYVVNKMVLDLDDVKFAFRNDFIQFVIDNKDKPKDFWLEDIHYDAPFNETLEDMAVWVMSDKGNVMYKDEYYHKREFFEEERRALRVKLTNNEISEEVFNNSLKQLKIKYSEFYPSIPTSFEKEIIEQIIELDNLHPLELV